MVVRRPATRALARQRRDLVRSRESPTSVSTSDRRDSQRDVWNRERQRRWRSVLRASCLGGLQRNRRGPV